MITLKALVAGMLLLASCSTLVASATPPPDAGRVVPAGPPPNDQVDDVAPTVVVLHAGARDDRFGQAVANALTRRYGDTPSSCSGNHPAWRCSGIIERAIVGSTQFDPLNPSPNSQNSGGVSASYLRSDAPFSPGYNYQGYIFLPADETPVGMQFLAVQCIFALDGWTDHRPSRGCGAYPGWGNTAPCRSINVTTAQQWVDNLRRNNNDVRGQCGFDVTDVPGGTQTPDFQALMAAKKQLGAQGFNDHAEVRIATWDQDIQQRLAVAAFYAFKCNGGGLGWAKYYQDRYFNQTGVVIPVICYFLPENPTQSARFTYDAANQTHFPPDITTLMPNLLVGKANNKVLTLDGLAGTDVLHIGIPPYAGMQQGDRLRVSAGTGNPGPFHEVNALWVQSADIPTSAIIAAINNQPGGDIPLSFTVERPGASLTSKPRLLTISPVPAFATPTPELRTDHDQLMLGGWTGQTSGYRLTLFWKTADTERTAVLETKDSTAVTWPLSSTWLEDIDGKHQEAQARYVVRDSKGSVVGISNTLTIPPGDGVRLDAPVIDMLKNSAGIDVLVGLKNSEANDVVVVTLHSDGNADIKKTLRVRATDRTLTFRFTRDDITPRTGRYIAATYTIGRGDVVSPRSYANSQWVP